MIWIPQSVLFIVIDINQREEVRNHTITLTATATQSEQKKRKINCYPVALLSKCGSDYLEFPTRIADELIHFLF